MTKIVNKCRLCRRERTKLFLKGARCFSPKCPIDRKGAVPPGAHGFKSGFRMSEYGTQLREKQKAKRMYGVFERQFKNYYLKAGKLEGDRGENFLRLLEIRLDNVLCRLALVPSRRAARQFITHGRVLVNDKKVRSPSYAVKVGDYITLTPRGGKMKEVEVWQEKKDIKIPEWLKKKGLVGKMEALPSRDQMPTELKEKLIIEFYSR